MTKTTREREVMTEAELDEQSRPLRDAAQTWAREHGAGLNGGWDPHNRIWDYVIRVVVGGPVLVIKVAEDGSEASVRVRGRFGRESVAKTPRGLCNVMTKAIR